MSNSTRDWLLNKYTKAIQTIRDMSSLNGKLAEKVRELDAEKASMQRRIDELIDQRMKAEEDARELRQEGRKEFAVVQKIPAGRMPLTILAVSHCDGKTTITVSDNYNGTV